MRGFVSAHCLLVVWYLSRKGGKSVELKDSGCPISKLARKAGKTMDRLSDEKLDRAACDVVDMVVEGTAHAIRTYGGVAEVLVGTALVLHGGELETTILFAQALREVGGPQLREACEELGKRWSAGVEALKKETPTLRAMHSSLRELEHEARELRKAVSEARRDAADGVVAQRDLRRYEAEIKREFGDIVRAANRARATAQPLRKVVEALDPASCRKVLDGAWNVILTCAATATSGRVANVGVGLGLGRDFDPLTAGAAGPLAQSFLDKACRDPLGASNRAGLDKWASGFAAGWTRYFTIKYAFKHQNLALTVSSAALGSRVIVTGVDRLNKARKGIKTPIIPPDPFLAATKPYDTRRMIHVGKATLGLAVGGLGVAFQLKTAGKSFQQPAGKLASTLLGASVLGGKTPPCYPTPFRVFLTPAFFLDRSLKKFAPALKAAS